MKLSEYIKKRNGVPIGHTKSLQNNLKRSLGAKNFSTFWNFWNPIFSYYLGTKIFKPLKKVFSIGLSLVLTFVFCGLIHDLVTTVVRAKISLFFTVWFFIMGILVVLSKQIDYDLSHKKWILRAFVNLSLIGVSLFLTNVLNRLLHFY